MPGEIVVSSTTDSQEEVNAAAGVSPEPKPEAEAEEQPTEQPKPEETPEPGEEKEEQEAAPAAPKRSKGGFQKRIDLLNRRNFELEEMLERQSSRLEEALTRLETDAARAPAAPEGPRAKPALSDFKTYEDYIEAIADWKSEQRLAEYRARQEQEQLQAQQQAEARRTQQVFSSYNQRVAEFKSEVEDFDQVTGRDDIQIPQAVQLAVIEMDNGPEVAYYFGLHPEVCEKLVGMTPLQSVIEAGRIADALKAGREPSSTNGAAKRPVSSAPKPIRAVAGTAPSAVPLDQMDYRDYRRIRDQQVKNRYRRG